MLKAYSYFNGFTMIVCVSDIAFQPVGFVTFSTRAGAEAAKQELQVSGLTHTNYPRLKQCMELEIIHETMQ